MRIVRKGSRSCPRTLLDIRVVAVLGISLCWSAAALAQASSLDLDNAWFQPALVVDDDPVCGDLLNRVTTSFFSTEELPDMWRTPNVWFPDMERITFKELQSEPVDSEAAGAGGAGAGEHHFIIAGGRKVYFEQVSSAGCGGRCDRRIFFTSNQPFQFVRDEARSEEVDAHRLSVSDYGYSLLRSVDGKLYIASLDVAAYLEQGKLAVYRLAANANWVKACEVVMDPGNIRRSANPHVQAFLASLDALQDAMAGVARGEGGSCGTLRPGAAGYGRRTAALETALYRPWVLFAIGNTPNARGQSAYDEMNLEHWAVTGISEYAALANYRAQRAETGARLADFYTNQFEWPRSQAEQVARVVLAASTSFAFPSGYDPFVGGAVRELRRAILELRPLAEIRAIDIDLAGIDGDADPRRESVLNVAVRYPEALQYLLERGADSNRANAFGKTPLMYAAQYDGVEAAKLLLESGADPNAQTVWPSDRCYYSLTTASMTPLHYAVRYASPEFVKLLIDRGAVTYIPTKSTGWRREPGYPLDWLRLYSAAESEERNVLIAADEIPELAELLAVPSAESLAEAARRMTLQAEAEYARGDVAAAYATLQRALDADPDNVRALSDLSLVGLRVDRTDEAAVAAFRVIGSTGNPDLLAAAWFNLGRACETEKSTWAAIEFDNVYPCRFSTIYPFLQSWLTQPGDARANALQRVFAERATCTVRREDGSTVDYYLHSNSLYESDDHRSYRLYAWHAAEVEVNAGTIRWTGSGSRPETAEALASYDMGGSVLSVFKAPGYSSFTVGGLPCGD